MGLLEKLKDTNIDPFEFMLNLELTPDKSKIVQKGNIIKIKYIGKKGAIKARNTCKDCKYVSIVQIGLGFALVPCCCKVEGEWRELSGWTKRKCDAFIEQETLNSAEDGNIGE